MISMCELAHVIRYTVLSQNFHFCCCRAIAYIRLWNWVQFCLFNYKFIRKKTAMGISPKIFESIAPKLYWPDWKIKEGVQKWYGHPPSSCTVWWRSAAARRREKEKLGVFTALHGMQTRSCDEVSVRPSVCPSVRQSVCPSVCQTRALWQNGRKLCLDFYITWKNIYPSFLKRRMVGGGDPFYLKFWVNRPSLERNRRFRTDNRS